MPIASQALPPPLMTSEPGSFAEKTIVVRKPQIIQRVIEDNAYPAEIETALAAFREEIATQPIAPLTEEVADVSFWNSHLAAHMGKTWREVPWYFAETLFYRRLLEATRYFQPGPWQRHDPFGRQKRDQEANAIDRLTVAWPQIEALPLDVRFEALLHACLWGNRADLSNFTVTANAHQGADAQAERENIIIDHTEQVVVKLKQGVTRIAFINDNVGADSLFDLALADFLLTQGWTQEVVFNLKNQPFFVSDAMPVDIQIVIKQLTSSPNQPIAALGTRLSKTVAQGTLRLATDSFWTTCLSFFHMPPALHDSLADAAVTILKGDVNYRRLLDDRHWPHDTPISTITANFPKPYLILRTLKGEIMVGLAPGQAETLTKQDPTWLINGKRGVIQWVNS